TRLQGDWSQTCALPISVPEDRRRRTAGKQGLLLGHLKSHISRTEKRGLVIHGYENESLEAEEVIEQSGLQNELHQTRTRIQQTRSEERRVGKESRARWS